MTRVWLGVDPGDVRIGLAVSDANGSLAMPLRTLAADRKPLEAIAIEIQHADVQVVIVGLPRSMDGSENRAAVKARTFAHELANLVPVPVRLVDERLSTVSASRALHQAGRRSKQQREVIDQVAAVQVLQLALDLAKISGDDVGELVPSDKAMP